MKQYSFTQRCFGTFILLFAFCVQIPAQAKSTYLLPTNLVNLYLQIHAPIAKDFSPFFKIQLDSPEIISRASSQRIELASPVLITLPNLNTIKGFLKLSSSYRYDGATKKLLLREPKIESLEIAKVNASTDKILEQINPYIAQLFNGVVVYTFEDEKRMVLKAPSQIMLEDQGIRFYFD